MAERRSMGDKGKQVVRRAGETFQTVTGTLSGKNIEQQVAEYSELYTQVLLGLHQDLRAQDRRLHDFASEIEALRRQAEDEELHDYASEVKALKRQVASMGRIRLLAIAAFVAAALSLSIAVVAVVQA